VSDPALLLPVDFLLTVPICVLLVLLFAIYILELLKLKTRIRALGICHSRAQRNDQDAVLSIWLLPTTASLV
jgi:hypothetical protein